MIHKLDIGQTSTHCFAVLVAVYLLQFGWMLSATNGMPYVMDNNESYSSLVHAQSVSQFGVSKSMGLADEALGASPNAHPYVHSHQGNFPRIFAWAIYELGATTPARQIVVTTFTVGLAAICLAFGFFSIVANPVLALLICLAYLTDYVCFSQWQVDTYRVWYAFVFFLQFYAVEKVLSTKRSYWFLVLAANTALFIYGELIFAAFLGIASFAWLLVRGLRQPRIIVWVTACMAIGVASALVLFSTQGIGYLGVENFLRDVRLTFGARNNFAGGNLAMAEIAAFYRDHKVIFWENIQGRDEFIGIVPFVRSLLQNFMQINGPLPVICFSVFVIAWIVAQFVPRTAQGAPRTQSAIVGSGMVGKVRAYVFVSVCAFALITAANFMATHYYDIIEWNPVDPSLLAAEVAVMVCLLAMIAGAVLPYALAVLAMTAIAIASLPAFLGKDYQQLWLATHGSALLPHLIWLVPGAAVVALAWVAGLIRQEPPERDCLRGTFIFVLIGLGAYTLVYHLTPGYVYSGYVARYAPFFVYFLNVVLAVPVFMAISTTWESLARLRSGDCSLAASVIFAVGLAVLAGFGWLWFGVQSSYVRLLPPDYFEVLQKLDDPPYKNSSFVVSNYAGPVGAQTRQWAYFDPGIGNALFAEVDGVRRLVGDRRYLWLADRDTNPAYRRPDYFLCLYNQGPPTVLTHVLSQAHHGLPPLGCSNLPLVRSASGLHPLPGLTLVDIDKEGPKRLGFAAWAIVKLDWDKGLGGGMSWLDEQSETRQPVHSKP